MKNKKICILFLLCIGFNQVNAQLATTASGGNASGIGGSVAYSLGQIVYKTNTGITGSEAQGVQQPFEISITLGLKETGVNLNLSAYPNPTINYLTLQIDASIALSNQLIFYQLYDISGKLLESNTIVANSTTIKMELYVTATYFLKVLQKQGIASVEEIKTFKIIKN